MPKVEKTKEDRVEKDKPWQDALHARNEEKQRNLKLSQCVTNVTDALYKMGAKVIVPAKYNKQTMLVGTVVNCFRDGEYLVRLHASNDLETYSATKMCHFDPDTDVTESATTAAAPVVKEPKLTDLYKLTSGVRTRNQRRESAFVEVMPEPPSLQDKATKTNRIVRRLGHYNKKGFDDIGLAQFGDKF